MKIFHIIYHVTRLRCSCSMFILNFRSYNEELLVPGDKMKKLWKAYLISTFRVEFQGYSEIYNLSDLL